MNLRKYTIIICIVWILVVLIWIVQSELIIKGGREVLLKTVPVDPRDLFMGDYVILNYEISRLPKEYRYIPNKEVYTILKTDENNIGYIDRIEYDKKPQNELFLKGKMSKCNSGNCINYGIESYYVKEHKGKKIEEELRNGAFVRVKADRSGRAKVVGFANGDI